MEEHFKYLGVVFNYNGSFVKHKKHLYDQAQKAMFALLKRNRELDLPIDIQLELFDSLVLPILLYGCEVWGGENTDILEKLHLKYIKYILGLKMSTPTCMILGETGRFPVNISIKLRLISYWSNVVQPDNHNKLSVIMYNVIYAYHINEMFKSNWLTFVNNILLECDLNHMWLYQSTFVKFPANIFKPILQSNFMKQWKCTVYNSRKCVLYRIYKEDFSFENYLYSTSRKVRRTLSQITHRTT